MRKRLLSPGNPLDQLLIIPLGKRPGIILPVRSKVPVAGAMPGEIGQKKTPGRSGGGPRRAAGREVDLFALFRGVISQIISPIVMTWGGWRHVLTARNIRRQSAG